MYGTGDMQHGMGWGWILGLLILAGVIWFVVKVFKQYYNASQLKSKSALDILKERYARGEIDKDEYEEKWRNINS